MARFDVYKYSGNVPLLVDVQAGLLSSLKTRVVIPLVPHHKVKNETVPRLKPVIRVKGRDYLLMTTDIGTVLESSLGPLVGSIEDQRYDITDALDFLFQGF